MTPLRRIQSAEQNLEDIESIMELYPTQTPEHGEMMREVATCAASKVTGQETVEIVPVDPKRTHLPPQAHAPQDALTEVTSSIPPSLPHLAPTSQTNLGPTAPCPEGIPRGNLCPICQDPGCQGEQECDVHCLSCRGAMHRLDTCPANALSWPSVVDQEGHERGALVNLESAIPSKIPIPGRRWAREREAEEEF